MKVFLFLCLLLPLKLYADVTSSCQSTLSGAHTRTELSDVCYTQYGDQFLQWQGYWVDNANKAFTPVGSWPLSLSAMLVEADWRLPTIKELQLLTTKGLIDTTNLAPDAFSENWMLQQWLIRGGVIPSADAYLLSSSYQGDNGNGTTKVFALNLATGLTEALSATNFDSKSVYMVKVKQESPVWHKVVNQSISPDFTAECLVNTDAIDTDLVIAACSGNKSIERWYYEENTGFLRSYNGLCAKALGIVNADKIQLGSCDGDLARWNTVVDVNDASRYYFQHKASATVCFYAAQANGSGGIKTRDVANSNFTAVGCDDGGSDDHVTWKLTP